MNLKLYQSYSFAIFGARKVGKTSIINRFIKDQFQQNMRSQTLECIFSNLIDVDGKIFQINIHDTTQRQNSFHLKDHWRSNKHGFIFTFAVNCQNSLQKVLDQIDQVQAIPQFRYISIILIGNKSDLQLERSISQETVKQESEKRNVKYFQISAKQSSKQEIDMIILQLIDANEMGKYYSETLCQNDDKNSSIMSRIQWHPCEDSNCSIM